MNIEAIDFLNQLNEYGKIDYSDYSNLHDLLTSDGAEWEYGARAENGRVLPCSEDFALQIVRSNELPDLVQTVRRRKAGPWEKVEA